MPEQAELLALAARVERVEERTERSPFLSAEAAAAVIGIAQRESVREAAEVMHEKGHLRTTDMREILNHSELTAEEVRAQIDLHIAQVAQGRRFEVERTSIRFMEWFEAEDSIDEFAHKSNVGFVAMRNSVVKFTKVALGIDVKPIPRVKPVAAPVVNKGISYEQPYWRDEANCLQADPEVFFPERGGSTRDAKKLCNACDVKQQCLEYALEHDETIGIWGGLSQNERKKLHKAR